MTFIFSWDFCQCKNIYFYTPVYICFICIYHLYTFSLSLSLLSRTSLSSISALSLRSFSHFRLHLSSYLSLFPSLSYSLSLSFQLCNYDLILSFSVVLLVHFIFLSLFFFFYFSRTPPPLPTTLFYVLNPILSLSLHLSLHLSLVFFAHKHSCSPLNCLTCPPPSFSSPPSPSNYFFLVSTKSFLYLSIFLYLPLQVYNIH